ncbi:uncharacterized protein [Asterias amurensis]|uniref:uncharacterized protein n=1 Tax=Asterias amurensis TaxID=7602 RepID=UPI003AB6D673
MARAVTMVFLMAGALFIATTNLQGVSGEKPGLCPESSGAWGAALCVQACSNDESCQGTKKCCENSCGGRHCSQVVHPGTCPVIPPGMGGICGSVCASDGECSIDKKCCHNGCGPTCLTAGPVVHPGLCPVVAPGVAGICGPVCASDGECDNNKKCCDNGCGKTCLAPF